MRIVEETLDAAGVRSVEPRERGGDVAVRTNRIKALFIHARTVAARHYPSEPEQRSNCETRSPQ